MKKYVTKMLIVAMIGSCVSPVLQSFSGTQTVGQVVSALHNPFSVKGAVQTASFWSRMHHPQTFKDYLLATGIGFVGPGLAIYGLFTYYPTIRGYVEKYMEQARKQREEAEYEQRLRDAQKQFVEQEIPKYQKILDREARAEYLCASLVKIKDFGRNISIRDPKREQLDELKLLLQHHLDIFLATPKYDQADFLKVTDKSEGTIFHVIVQSFRLPEEELAKFAEVFSKDIDASVLFDVFNEQSRGSHFQPLLDCLMSNEQIKLLKMLFGRLDGAQQYNLLMTTNELKSFLHHIWPWPADKTFEALTILFQKLSAPQKHALFKKVPYTPIHAFSVAGEKDADGARFVKFLLEGLSDMQKLELLKMPASFFESSNTLPALYCAIRAGRPETVKAILDLFMPHGLITKKPKELNELLQQGWDKYKTPLEYAKAFEKSGAMKTIISYLEEVEKVPVV